MNGLVQHRCLFRTNAREIDVVAGCEVRACGDDSSIVRV